MQQTGSGPLIRLDESRRPDVAARLDGHARVNVDLRAAAKCRQERPFKLAVVTDETGFLELRDEWCDLCSRVPGLFYSQTFDWAAAGWRHVACPRGRSFFLLLGRAEGRLVLIWPLVTYRRFGICHGLWLGSETTEYRDILVEPGTEAGRWVETAFRFVERHSGIDVLYCRNVRADGALGGVLASRTKERFSATTAPFVDLTRWPDWQSFESNLDGNLRRNLNRRLRRLHEVGKVDIEVGANNVDPAECLQWLFGTKLAWLRRHRLTSRMFESEDCRAFVVAIVEQAARGGTLYLSRLKVADRTIAVNLGFVYRERFELLNLAHDPDWHAYSPGRILQREALRWAFEHGHAVFDMRPGAQAYKFDWTDEAVPVSDYRLSFSAIGELYRLWSHGRIRGALKGVYRGLPKSLQRLYVAY